MQAPPPRHSPRVFNGFLQLLTAVPDGRYIFAEVQSQPGFLETVSLTEADPVRLRRGRGGVPA